MGNKIHIFGGGTFSYVRNHLALAAPAFGETARKLATKFNCAIQSQLDKKPNPTNASDQVHLHLTKMADHTSKLVTNEDVATLLEELKTDPETRVIILNAALCDYDGEIETLYGEEKVKSGSHAERLKTAAGQRIMFLRPAPKLIGNIRKERKDIFVVGFKTTTGKTSDEQYQIALNALKRDGINLILTNDTVTRNNMIVAPEETRYFETTDRDEVLDGLVKMVLARSTNTFTRSTVLDGPSVAWDDHRVPENLRVVVDHCIARGAYKPFRGVTAGHFAVKLDQGRILTSKRKRNFNNLSEEGLVLVEYEGDEKVIAYGAKPSVGGQSQRVVFREHPEAECIVHFHCPLKDDHEVVPIAPQWQNECGSLQCGQNTSRNLGKVSYPGILGLETGYPTLIISSAFCGDGFNQFIQSISQPCIIIFDEFEMHNSLGL